MGRLRWADVPGSRSVELCLRAVEDFAVFLEKWERDVDGSSGADGIISSASRTGVRILKNCLKHIIEEAQLLEELSGQSNSITSNIAGGALTTLGLENFFAEIRRSTTPTPTQREYADTLERLLLEWIKKHSDSGFVFPKRNTVYPGNSRESLHIDTPHVMYGIVQTYEAGLLAMMMILMIMEATYVLVTGTCFNSG